MLQEHHSSNVRELSNSFLAFLLVFVSCLLVISTQTAHADGKFFPEKAYKIPPAIPSQRAILVYKEGTETLIIESALDGKGKDFGWVIPLPSKPTEFDKASPGLIKTLSLTIQPKIVHDLSRILEPLYIISVVITLGTLFVIAIKPKRIISFVLICFVIVAMLVVSIIMMMMLQSTAGTTLGGGDNTRLRSVLGIDVLDFKQIGSYELIVLDANSPDALNQWLGRNGFSGLTNRDQEIVADYIKNGWCFVAARLRREGDGYSRPHPLAMSFASRKLIYPMRLTATLDSELYLELFVIADRTAKCRELTLDSSDKYCFTKKAQRNLSGDGFYAGFIGQTYHQKVGHPDSRKHMWDGCIVSKLCGVMLPQRMDKDLAIELKPWKSYQKRYYSLQGAREVGWIVCLSVWLGLLVLLIAVFYRRIIKKGGRKFDTDGSRNYDFIDFSLLANDWLDCTEWYRDIFTGYPNCTYSGDIAYFRGDLDRNRYVNYLDLASLAEKWLDEY